MKEIKLLNILFLFSLILFTANSSEESEIHYVINATMNGTVLPIDLSTENDYVYFSFDFDEHSKQVPASKDTAFFSISSETPYINDNSVTFLFSNKNWSDITYSEVKDLTWEKTNIVYQEKSGMETKYYFKFTRPNEQFKSLLLRVSNNQQKTGFLTVENVSAIPLGSNSGIRNNYLSNLKNLIKNSSTYINSNHSFSHL